MAIKLICCDVFKEELNSMEVSPELDIEFVAMGLHLHPKKLHEELKRILENTQGYSMVIFGFGLCGGALKGLKAPGCPMVIPRVHDCIPILLGSKEKYNGIQQKNNKTFYFSGGWVEGERMVIPEYERSCIEFGEKKALRIIQMMFENYTSLTYIHTGHPRDRETLMKMNTFGTIIKLPCVETSGNLEFLDKVVNGPWDNDTFVVVPSDGVIEEAEFLSEEEEIYIQGS